VLGEDSAYNSTALTRTAVGAEVRVERLDDVWEEAGRPEVSVLKVDVEGAEVHVLAGAAELVRSSRPACSWKPRSRTGRRQCRGCSPSTTIA
jgi:FkbM family methyltransferase